MRSSISLMTYFESITNVIVPGVFVGKNGVPYLCETDIRYAMKTIRQSQNTAENIFDAIREILPLTYDSFIGVPETGTLLSVFLNCAMVQALNVDVECNCVRSQPKSYQGVSNSINTVLPFNNSLRYVLVEDDVVSGNSMYKCLDRLQNINANICAVVAVFARKNNYNEIQKLVDEKYGIPFYALLIVD